MRDIDRAIADISTIRAQLATTTQFRGFAPEMLVGVSVLFTAVMFAQMLRAEQLALDDMGLVITWGGMLLLTTAASAIEAMIRSRRQHGGMAAPMWRSAMQIVGPVWATGSIIAVIVALHAPAVLWIVPGIWLLLIGIVGFAFHGTMPAGVAWVALFYMVSGAVTLSIAGAAGHLTPSLIGIPFVLGNLVMALILQDASRKQRHG